MTLKMVTTRIPEMLWIFLHFNKMKAAEEFVVVFDIFFV